MWQETDGLDPDDFDPKTFFKLHGNSTVHVPQGRARADLFFLMFQTTTETGSWTKQNWRLSSAKRFQLHGCLMLCWMIC